MAIVSREIEAPSKDVFDVIVDPRTYPRWLAGAADMRAVDDDWPAVGSRFHHRVGFKPFTIPDSSLVQAIEYDRMLRLVVRARPLLSAVVTFSLVGDDDRCVITFEEEPAVRLIGNLVRPVLDPVTHVRNHLSLKRLDDLIRNG
ncbi:MAG: SRPBCC family protein [Acidimicrobiales bacterium]